MKTKPGADNDLHAFCTREGIPHIIFENFHEVMPIVRKITSGEVTPAEAMAVGKA